MLAYVTIIIFAIHAVIKLGQKIRTVFEDEVRDRDLILPPVSFVPADLPFWEPEVCRWLGRAEPVLAKFPDTAYPRQSITLTYKNKFERLNKAECQSR
jgi:hypothetical protein